MKQWEHNELAEDLGDAKQTNFLDVPLGSVYLGILDRANKGIINEVQRADVIEVKPSYNRFCVSIYEVKVSRSDFLSDIRSGKWRGYLDHCHRFYFAVPSGMVKKEEMPEEAGLIVRGEKGWQTQKAAVCRDIEIPYFTLLSMIFSKQREYYRTKQRNRVFKAHQWWHTQRNDLYKVLGKKLCDALVNFEDYKAAKSHFESKSKYIEELIKDGLGIESHWPDWELKKLVRKIKEKAEKVST
jgi:hypothetical protein